MSEDINIRRPVKARGSRWAVSIARHLANKMVKPNHISILSVVICCVACVGMKAHDDAPHVHIRLQLEGNQPVEDAMAKIGKYYTVAGGIAGQGATNHLFFDHPLTEHADIMYRLPSLKEQKIIKVLLPRMPENNVEHITVIFSINAENETVKVRLEAGR